MNAAALQQAIAREIRARLPYAARTARMLELAATGRALIPPEAMWHALAAVAADDALADALAQVRQVIMLERDGAK